MQKPNANEFDRQEDYNREFSVWRDAIAKRTPGQDARDNERHEQADEYAKYNRDCEVE